MTSQGKIVSRTPSFKTSNAKQAVKTKAINNFLETLFTKVVLQNKCLSKILRIKKTKLTKRK